MNDTKLPQFLKTEGEDLRFIWPTLKKAGYNADEESLLAAIYDNKSKKIVHYAVIGLRHHGTTKSIPVLKRLIGAYSSEDVKDTSVVTLGVIARDQQTAYYASLLDDPSYKDKIFPMIVIWETGNEEALPAVLRYAQDIIVGNIKRFSHRNYYQYILEYLRKYTSQEVNDTVKRLELIEQTSGLD